MAIATSRKVRRAEERDLSAVTSLINRAFKVENFFKNADRTDLAEVQENTKLGTYLVLEDEDQVVACAFVKITGERAYLGTLSVDPKRQKSGLGARMMVEAETHARAAGCKFLDIRIVNLRTELPGIYRKFGFIETGKQFPGPIPSPSRFTSLPCRSRCKLRRVTRNTRRFFV